MSEQRIIRPHEQVRGSRRTPLIHMDWDGAVTTEAPTSTRDMSLPCLCTCGAIYDGGHVTVTARYADCSVWKAPCCGREADSRHAWNGGPGQRMGHTDIRARDREINERTRR